MTQNSKLGLQLSTLRYKKNLSRLELLNRSGVSTATIQAIEEGKRLPHISTIIKLSNGLGDSEEERITNFQILTAASWEDAC